MRIVYIQELLNIVDKFIDGKLKKKPNFYKNPVNKRAIRFHHYADYYEKHGCQNIQHLFIKAGHFNECFFRTIITKYSPYKILPNKVSKVIEKRKMDLILIDKKTKSILNFELKNNPGLDNGKTINTSEVINRYHIQLSELYPEYKIESFILSNLENSNQLSEIKKTDIVPLFKLIGFDTFFNLVKVDIDENDYILSNDYYDKVTLLYNGDEVEDVEEVDEIEIKKGV